MEPVVSTQQIVYPLSDQNVLVFLDDWNGKSSSYDQPETPSDQIRNKWRQQQRHLASQLVISNQFSWNWSKTPSDQQLRYIGGVDLSFAKDSKVDACACIVVCAYPSLQVVYECYSMVKLRAPYIAGFLAFREVPCVVQLLHQLKQRCPQYLPQLLMVDGNGILHMRGLGSASHLGLVCDIPTLGVAKRLLYCDDITDQTVEDSFNYSKRTGDPDIAPLVGRSGIARACAYKAKHRKGSNILYISPGHKIDLRTSVQIVRECMIGNNLPEPVFQADHLSREFLRLNYQNL